MRYNFKRFFLLRLNCFFNFLNKVINKKKYRGIWVYLLVIINQNWSNWSEPKELRNIKRFLSNSKIFNNSSHAHESQKPIKLDISKLNSKNIIR